MVTTVNETTVELVRTVAVTSLALAPILALLLLLIQKEVSSSLPGGSADRLNRALSIGLVPLAMIFLAALAVSVAAVLR